MKLWHVVIYVIIIFLLSFSALSITGELVTNYLFPSTPNDAMKNVMISTNRYFNRALAFSFFIFLVFSAPVIVSYLFKTRLLLNILLSLSISIFLWFLVYLYANHMVSTAIEYKLLIDLNPLYEKMSFLIGSVTTIFVFLISFIRAQDREK